VAGEIRSLFLPGAAGRLEALLNEGQPNATHSALICHPHPLFGGTMHNKVVFAAMKALNGLGFPALRFNFRGAGLSEGKHDQGHGEQDDVRAGLDWLEREFHLPIVFAGFSFGAVTGLRVCCPDERVAGVISMGTPISAAERLYTYSFLAKCEKPKLFISGTNDEYGARDLVQGVFDEAAAPKKMVWIEGEGHYMYGKLGEVREAIAGWTRDVVIG
jgi:alpha/beta superfamily hydrolase